MESHRNFVFDSRKIFTELFFSVLLVVPTQLGQDTRCYTIPDHPHGTRSWQQMDATLRSRWRTQHPLLTNPVIDNEYANAVCACPVCLR